VGDVVLLDFLFLPSLRVELLFLLAIGFNETGEVLGIVLQLAVLVAEIAFAYLHLGKSDNVKQAIDQSDYAGDYDIGKREPFREHYIGFFINGRDWCVLQQTPFFHVVCA
jgi:hypothetical protein